MHIDIHKRTKIMSKAIIYNGYYKNYYYHLKEG